MERPPWRNWLRKEEASKEPEFIPVERRAPLSLTTILEDPEQVSEAVDSYVSSMNEYATQHDVFISKDKVALQEKGNALVELSKSLTEAASPMESKRIESQMESLIDEINGSLSDTLVTRATENQSRNAQFAEESKDFSISAQDRKGPIRAMEELGTPMMDIKVPSDTSGSDDALELTNESELPADATHAETARHLQNTVAAVIAENPRDQFPSATTKYDEYDPSPTPAAAEAKYSKQKAELAARKENMNTARSEEREKKASEFAERFGLGEARESLHAAEEAYTEALQHKRATIWPRKGKAVTAAQEEYDAARLAWRNALSTATEGADRKDLIMARFIGMRDTAVRPEALRQEAARAALEAKEGKLGTKVTGWLKRGAFGVLGGYQKSTGWVGNKLAEFSIGKVGEEMSPEEEKEYAQQLAQMSERYTRNFRIIGGAAVATVVTGGFAGLGLPLLLRLARGFGSTALGAAAGKAAGSLYERKTNAGRKEALLDTIGTREGIENSIGISDVDSLKAEELAYVKGNAKARAANRQFWETIATVGVAGSSSLLSGMAVSHFNNLEAVQKAVKDISENTVSGSPVPTSAPSAASTPSGIPTHIPAPEITTPSAINSTPTSSISMVAGATIDHRGEGSGVLFEHLKAAIRENGSFAKNPSSGLKHFLESNPNDMSREMGKAAFDGHGMRMQMGDQFFVDENQNIYFQPKIGERQLFIEHSGKVHELVQPGPPQVETPKDMPKASVQPERAARVSSEPVAPVSPLTPEAVASAPSPLGTGTNSDLSASANDNAPMQPEAVSPIPEAPSSPSAPEYTPQTAPTPDAVPSTSAPTSDVPPAAPSTSVPIESAPSVSSSSAETIFTNARGLSLDTSVPSAYSYNLPDGKNIMVMFGGTNDDRLVAVQQYLSSHPSTTVRFENVSTDLLTNKPIITMMEWSSDENGTVLMTPSSTLEGEVPLPKIDPNLITKKLNFNYVKQ